MYWSVHQYQRPTMGAQINIPTQGKLPLKYQASFKTFPAASVSSTGAQVPSTPAGIIGFQRLNISEPHQWRSSCQPPSFTSPYAVRENEPRMSTKVCTASLYATARIPPRAVYKPVRTITRTEPIQNESMVVPPIVICSSGNSVPKTTPPAKIPTAIFETMKVMIETTDNT